MPPKSTPNESKEFNSKLYRAIKACNLDEPTPEVETALFELIMAGANPYDKCDNPYAGTNYYQGEQASTPYEYAVHRTEGKRLRFAMVQIINDAVKLYKIKKIESLINANDVQMANGVLCNFKNAEEKSMLFTCEFVGQRKKYNFNKSVFELTLEKKLFSLAGAMISSQFSDPSPDIVSIVFHAIDWKNLDAISIITKRGWLQTLLPTEKSNLLKKVLDAQSYELYMLLKDCFKHQNEPFPINQNNNALLFTNLLLSAIRKNASEETIAGILALPGFTLDTRNIERVKQEINDKSTAVAQLILERIQALEEQNNNNGQSSTTYFNGIISWLLPKPINNQERELETKTVYNCPTPKQ